jgi:hypothetical protein
MQGVNLWALLTSTIAHIANPYRLGLLIYYIRLIL